MQMLPKCKLITVSEDGQKNSNQEGAEMLKEWKPTWLEETMLVLSSVPFSSGQTG